MKKGIIFDMDGTLWDSVDEIVYSWNEALRAFPEAAVVLTREKLLAFMGKTMDKFAEGLFPHLSAKRGLEILHECEQKENDYLREHGARLLGDVAGTFRRLREAGCGVYIVSNCQAGYIEAFLDFFHLEDLVDDFECYGRTLRGKPENLRALIARNELTDYCYLGDTQGDYDACREAGVPFVWASYGFGTVGQDVPAIGRLEEIAKHFNDS